MELAKVTSKGQITIPHVFRERFNIKTGDKLLFFEENGRCFFQNANPLTLARFQEEMNGMAEKAGFNDPDDVTNYIKQLRKHKK